MGIIVMGNWSRLNKDIDTNAVLASKIFSDDTVTNAPNDTKATC